jgi:hypothetical protein
MACQTRRSVSSGKPWTRSRNDPADAFPATTAAHASSTRLYRSIGDSASIARATTRERSSSSYQMRTKLAESAFATTTASGPSSSSSAPSASIRMRSTRSSPPETWRTISGTGHVVSSSSLDGMNRRWVNRTRPPSRLTEIAG